LLYTVTDQDIAFLVPDSCWAMVRNGNSISADFTEDTIKNNENNALFWQYGSCVGFSNIAE
jgi:hypothetical protein